MKNFINLFILTKRMSLHVIFGPMFSGKSTELGRLAGRALSVSSCLSERRILLINSYLDTRSSESCIRTHTGVTIPAIKVKNLMDVLEISLEASLRSDSESNISDSDSNATESDYRVYNKATDIYIDEAQFFTDLYVFVKHALKDNKRIIVAGLDSDCHQHPFGQILSIIPLADSVEKKTALCSICAQLGNIYTEAPFTIKINDTTIDSVSVIDIGAQDKYISVCRKHL